MPRSLLDPDTLRNLLQQLEQTDVDELEVVSGSARLYLRRDPAKRALIAQGMPGGQHPDGTPWPVAPGVPVAAPLTGIYYSRPTPEQPPFAAVGTLVEPGQVVALIETMKLFNEVTADVAGEVIEIVANDGDLVETGQPIMYLREAA